MPALARAFSRVLAAQSLNAQGTAADYARSDHLNARYEGLTVNTPDRPTWIGRSPRLWYRRTVKGGYEFIVVDVAAKTKQPAFDHTKLAAAIIRAGLTEVPAAGRGGAGAAAPGTPTLVSATNLPFADFNFADDEHAIEFVATGSNWKCTITDYACQRVGPVSVGGRGGRGGRGGTGPIADDEQSDMVPFEGPWDDIEALGDEVIAQRLARQQGPPRPPADSAVRRSPDGKHEAYIENFNVYVRATGARTGAPLTYDGSEGGAYTLQSITWSPDSEKIAAYRVTPGYRRMVHYVESSPADQLQPKYIGARLREARRRPRRRAAGALRRRDEAAVHRRQRALPESVRAARSSRGARTAARSRSSTTSAGTRCTASSRSTRPPAGARAVIAEEPKTFFDYRTANGGLTDSGRRFRYDVDDGKEDHLDVGARRLEPPLSVRRRDRPGEEPDHEGRLGRARRRARRRGEAPDLVHARAAWTRARIRTSSTTTASTSTAPA